ncbi:MAG: isoprenylcysteine carboxylmethyltransferase family protein [Candidatus Bathyarchaeota archaeon]
MVWLIIFTSLNLLNLARTLRVRRQESAKAYAEVKRPQGIIFALAAFGTLFFFVESVTYPFIMFSGVFQTGNFPLQLRFQHDSYIQVVGIILETAGYSLFLWSVLERGRYAVSWEMQEDHQLVTSGPYRYIRHPSYLAYFLMFLGLFLMLLNLAALVPLVAIPGYVGIASYEEQMLTKRFGSKYVEYQRRSGRFLPRMKR